MPEIKAASSQFAITIETGEKCFFIPGEWAIVGEKGIFVRNVELRVGSPAAIRVCKSDQSVSLPGVVCASYHDLGTAIEFKEKTGRAARQLATLMAA